MPLRLVLIKLTHRAIGGGEGVRWVRCWSRASGATVEQGRTQSGSGRHLPDRQPPRIQLAERRWESCSIWFGGLPESLGFS